MANEISRDAHTKPVKCLVKRGHFEFYRIIRRQWLSLPRPRNIQCLDTDDSTASGEKRGVRNKLVRSVGASAKHNQWRPRAAFKRFQNQPIRATGNLTEAG